MKSDFNYFIRLIQLQGLLWKQICVGSILIEDWQKGSREPLTHMNVLLVLGQTDGETIILLPLTAAVLVCNIL